MSKAKDRLYESLGGGRKRLDQLGYNAENGLTSKGNEPGRKKISEKQYDNEMRRTLNDGIAESQYARNGNYTTSRKVSRTGYNAGETVARGSGTAASRARMSNKTTNRKAEITDRANARTIQMYDRAFGETEADRTAAHADEKKRAEARAREEAIRRAQQAARGRR